MNLRVAMQGVDRITRQRNLFLVLTVALSITSSALSLKILAQEERIIMVPPLSNDVTISNRKVSSGYLEQMTMVFLNSLLDLSASDVLHKRDMILKYTSNSDPSFSKKINEYFADSLEKYKNFDLVTYFTVKNMEIDEAKGEVIARGILTSRYGKHGFESNPTSYRLSFEFSGGYLRLKEFNRVVEDKDKKDGKDEPKGAGA
ncbi:MAG: type IV conjugative transfer system protein TraE [Rickettsiaceae bacterium]|jgi:type IV conjugative transfer system protein TraE|nr:type IV conjugative transfer system protein TraE [Rickettsiaceae bacterium]